MSVKAPVARQPNEVEEIDRHLAVLSRLMKTAEKRDVYIRKINKLLDQRNQLTTTDA